MEITEPAEAKIRWFSRRLTDKKENNYNKHADKYAKGY